MRKFVARLLGSTCLTLALMSVALAGQTMSAASWAQNLTEGKTQLESGRVPQAIKSLSSVLTTSPNNAQGHLLLGQANLKAKQLEKARDELRLAMRLGKGTQVSADANRAMMLLPGRVLAPVSGDKSLYVAAAMQLLFMQRGVESGEGKKPAVIEFYAPWAEACKKLEPALEKAKGEYGDRVNCAAVNVDDPSNAQLVDRYGVSPVPTVIFVNPKGEVVTYTIGFTGEGAITDGIKQILKSS